MKCLLWIKTYARHFTHRTLLNLVKEVLSPFKQDKASFILSVSNLTGGHKNSNPQF